MAEWTTLDEMTAVLMNQKSVYVGAGAPGTPYDGQFWADISTDPPVVKVYDSTNVQWMAFHPTYYETQVGAWANPSVTPVSNGTLVVVYNSTQVGTRLYGYSNSAWVNITDLSLSAVPAFTRYYDASIAASDTYTPGDDGLFHVVDDGNDVRVELLYGGGVWHAASIRSAALMQQNPVLGDGTNLRIRNTDAVNANNVIIMRAVLQHQNPTYTKTTGSLASGATATVSTAGLYSGAFSSGEFNVDYYSDNATAWIIVLDDSSAGMMPYGLFISDGTNTRVHNVDAGVEEYTLMRWS